MKKEKLRFYPNEPGVLAKAGRFALGTSIWWVPALIMKGMGWGNVPIGAFYVGVLGTMLHPKGRKVLKGINGIFWSGFRRYWESVKISRLLRDTYDGAGLVWKEKEKDGQEVIIYPATWMEKDDANVYLIIRMIPGQTKKEWEQKIDSIAQVLGGRIVQARIGEGEVRIQVNRGAWDAGDVLYKVDEEPYLNIGVEPGGIFKWYFNQYPHCLIVGLTGAGKSTFMRNLMIQFPTDWTVRILDGKRIEFSFMRRYGYDVETGGSAFVRYVQEAREEMERRAKILEGKGLNEYVADPDMKPYFLVIDEFIYLIDEVPEKTAEKGAPTRKDVWAWIRDISLRGRALGVFLILITQRPDSEFLPTVVRDNMTLKVMLGGSETALQMVFGKEKSKGVELVEEKGMGYFMQADGEVRPFRFPYYSMEQFKKDLGNRDRGQLFDFGEEIKKWRKEPAEVGKEDQVAREFG